ncbi:MAG TPA: signal peptidase I [Opitutaceae bacterium]|nr:signal peptidase I [Opitutaceae bacterium]
MFGLFASVEKKMRDNAANWLELAEKIFNYRRDELKEAERAQLQQRMEGLRALLRERADASKMKLGIESLEEVLRRTGGTFYPKSTIQEYVEFFLVAAIVVLGVRTYFLQPFKIPTNSMWPSYYGMTPQVYKDPSKGPNPAIQAVRLVLFGASHREVVAPTSGSVSFRAFFDQAGGTHVDFRKARGRKWLIIPTDVREYTFYVNRQPVTLKVPYDFDFDPAFREAVGLTEQQFAAKLRSSPAIVDGVRVITLDQPVEKGKAFLSFDIMTGDQLLVDRLTYHFFPPKVGQGFVFRTDGIEKIGSEQYYIKRLVGLPGDKLEVKAPVLYRNDAPIKGSKAFDLNANRVAPYRGYAPFWALEKGQTVTVPEDGYYAMGDNSYNSSDSRYWGTVPKDNVVGRPLFVYFPFTSRWGPAR